MRLDRETIDRMVDDAEIVMGLDMYLYRKTYVKNWRHQSPSEHHQIVVLP